MEPHELLRYVVECFEKLNIGYFITGAVASIAYGEPRLTNDIDIVADLSERDVPRLKGCFPEEDYYFDEDAAADAVRRRFQFNIIHPASGLKIDVMVSQGNEFDISRFKRIRRIKALEDREANFASPEDVILKKMEYYAGGRSEKHLRDIAGMIKISAEIIDLDYISSWADKLGLRDTWKEVQMQASRKQKN
ncbi:MAG: nucleotidyltransferase family protein [Candidatus Aminicenantes bacterium]|nr:nucleotidyltransferase family protein [Candidatus Aminicenantes bacterium]